MKSVGRTGSGFRLREKNEREKFLEYLRKGIEKAPYIAERLFEKVFPESLDVKDYYAYAEQRMLK